MAIASLALRIKFSLTEGVGNVAVTAAAGVINVASRRAPGAGPLAVAWAVTLARVMSGVDTGADSVLVDDGAAKPKLSAGADAVACATASFALRTTFSLTLGTGAEAVALALGVTSVASRRAPGAGPVAFT